MVEMTRQRNPPERVQEHQHDTPVPTPGAQRRAAFPSQAHLDKPRHFYEGWSVPLWDNGSVHTGSIRETYARMRQLPLAHRRNVKLTPNWPASAQTQGAAAEASLA